MALKTRWWKQRSSDLVRLSLRLSNDGMAGGRLVELVDVVVTGVTKERCNSSGDGATDAAFPLPFTKTDVDDSDGDEETVMDRRD